MSRPAEQIIVNLIADAQIHIDAAHQLHLEDGVDCLFEGYRDAFLTLTNGLHDLTRSTR